MAQFDLKNHAMVGTGGLLSVREDDEITRKLAMLIEGECEGLGPLQAAKKFGLAMASTNSCVRSRSTVCSLSHPRPPQ